VANVDELINILSKNNHAQAYTIAKASDLPPKKWTQG